ncbi:hypothetical protein [Vibrio europaeus]|uniref:Uncharacterized protein n=2 Tax=Vibrio oreintalis group TaxID=1891919 RepID=A0A178J526_9VIBR|nr:hypothetical protein [Vibrio europaeus]MDC5706507.1 hypothetical protein [Vibrio europaeus]MDC5711960.1 hypothetical protein [Vibrio europaeus]MDC5716347.1 hypothetical protein [Vibrio europaeus]MDC5725918.1 hypothetical protein [Vibrio europaeus]MDC5732907.1 hypothetical protein [Vibrio europaeus]
MDRHAAVRGQAQPAAARKKSPNFDFKLIIFLKRLFCGANGILRWVRTLRRIIDISGDGAYDTIRI